MFYTHWLFVQVLGKTLARGAERERERETEREEDISIHALVLQRD